MIQVINRAFDILELIAVEPETPKSLGEISEKLNLNAGTCANIIKTMVTRNYLDKMDRQKGYCLGPMAYKLTGSKGYNKDLIRAAKQELEGLTKKLNENSLLAVLKGETRIAVLRVHGSNELQAITPAEKHAYETTSGRLLLAMLPDEEQEQFIIRYGLPKADTWTEASNHKGFLKQVKKIRSDRYALQITPGQIVGIAVPIYNHKKVIASLAIYLPLSRYKNADRDHILHQMNKSAEKIAKNMA